MRINAAHSFYHRLASDRLTFVYSGAFHDEHTAQLIALGEAALDGADVRRDERARLSFIMVEAYQNIVRHRAPLSADIAHTTGRCLFMLRCGTGYQQVLAVNPVQEKDASVLERSLERLRGKDRAELKEMFLTGLKNGGGSERGGAGLGLIEMARRSGNGLIHSLRKLDANNYSFRLCATLGVSDAADSSVGDVLDEIHVEAGQNDLLFLIKGARSTATQEALMRIVEMHMDDRQDQAQARTRAYLAATEFISGLSERKDDGVLILAREGEGYALLLGVALPAQAAASVSAVLHNVSTASRNELQQRYREGLLRRTRGEEVDELGLLELARHAVSPLEYQVDGNGEDVFVSVKALV